MQIFKKLFLLFLITFVNVSIAQEDEMMKAWMDYMTPSWGHEILAASEGLWNAEVTYWMSPDSEPTVSKGTMNVEMIMGGRYQLAKFESNMMGMPMQGMSLGAFDNVTQEFISTWIDNFGTGLMVSYGKFNKDGNFIESFGDMVDPMSGGKMRVREVYKFVSDTHQTMEMFMDFMGQEFKSMEIHYHRVK